MRLELASFPVTDIQFGAKTAYRDDGLLSISKDEILQLIKQDDRIAGADVEIVRPGDEIRIVGVRDAVEPRVKASGPGCVFPGIMGPVQSVGEGRTHRLSGMAIIASAHYVSSQRSGTSAPNAAILDMWGPGAAATPLGSTNNVVLIMNLTEGISEWDHHAAIQLAEFRLGQWLAETTLDLKPPETEVFELTPVDASLPKVVYILGAMTVVQYPHTAFSIYGLQVQESFPTLIHPNEFFDGAVTRNARNGMATRPYTWSWQNQP